MSATSYVNTTPKRNHPRANMCTCKYFTKIKMVFCAENIGENNLEFDDPEDDDHRVKKSSFNIK